MSDEHLSKEFKKKVFEISYAVYRVTALFDGNEPLAISIRREASEILRYISCYDVLPQNHADELISILGKIRAIRNLLLLARVNNFASSINFEVLDREYHKIEEFFSSKIEFLQNNNMEKLSVPAKKEKVIAASEDKRKLACDLSEQRRNIVSGYIARPPEAEKAERRNIVPGYTAKNNQTDFKASKTQNLIYKKNTNFNASIIKDDANSGNHDRQELIMDFLSKKDNIGIKDISMSFNDVGAKTIQRDLNELIKKRAVARNGERRWAVYSLVRE